MELNDALDIMVVHVQDVYAGRPLGYQIRMSYNVVVVQLNLPCLGGAIIVELVVRYFVPIVLDLRKISTAGAIMGQSEFVSYVTISRDVKDTHLPQLLPQLSTKTHPHMQLQKHMHIQ